VEAALELVWTFVLGLHLVVKRTNIGRDIPRCNGGSRGEERTDDGGREMHDCVRKDVTTLRKWQAGSTRVLCLAEHSVPAISEWRDW
jgi:hypothetical protein